MKPANDPNRPPPAAAQGPPIRVPGGSTVRPMNPNIPAQSPVTTNVTSHIVSTGNPALTSVKTIPVSSPRVVPHASTATLTLVGTPGTPGLRTVTPAQGIPTSFHVSKVPTTIASISGPRGAIASPMMRNIVTTPIMTLAGAGTPTSFVPGIRTLNRVPTPTSTSSPTVWTGKPGSTPTQTKITGATLPGFPLTPAGPRGPTSSLTVTARPVVAQNIGPRVELNTLRTTKPAGTPDKFIRAPRTSTTFTTPVATQSVGPFASQGGTPLTHLAVTPLTGGQGGPAQGTALTLQPIMVSTTANPTTTVKTGQGTPRQTALHPIGPKVIAQQGHGPAIITHLTTNIGGKPTSVQAAAAATTGIRTQSPQTSSGTPFTTTPGGTQVKVLAQGPILSDVLTQQGTTALIPPGSVFIQATQHTSVNERGAVVTSASYAAMPGFIYDASAGGGSLIATTGPAHGTPISYGTPSHQLIRTFAPTVTSTSGTMTMQVPAGATATFQTADDAARKAFPGTITTTPQTSNLINQRFNPIMLMEASGNRSPAPPPSNVNTPTPSSCQPEGTISSADRNPPDSHSSSKIGPTLLPQQHLTPTLQQHMQQGLPTPATTMSSIQSHVQASMSQQQQQLTQGSREPSSTTCNVPTTPTTTPSKFCASPRPSILRKRDHEGTPSKVQKNLGPLLAALSSQSSPPPSPPARPDSGEGGHGKDGNGGNSSGGSSTISATSSPGLPMDVDNGSCVNIKQEPSDMGDNGANGNSEVMSPRKKPRKQQLTGNELQEAPYVVENAGMSQQQIKKEGDGSQKTNQDGTSAGGSLGRAAAGRRRPSVSLLQAYRTCWKPCNNHFLRPSDVRPREERRPTVAELSSQKRVAQRARGWKLHHLSTQMEDLSEREEDVLSQLSDILSTMEASHPESDHNKDLNRTSELIKSNIQRSKVVRDQMDECRSQLMRLLEHTTPVVEIIKRNANRRQAKKKY